MTELTARLKEKFEKDYVRSMEFPGQLLASFEKEFGPSVMDRAERIIPKEKRAGWLSAKQEDERTAAYGEKLYFEITLLEQLKSEFGDRVTDILKHTVEQDETDAWQTIAANEESHTLDDFIRVLWEPLPLLGFEISVEKKDAAVYGFCTRCPIYEASKLLGGSEWLYELACARDFYNTPAFNPEIVLKREKTLMQGHDRCEFIYSMKG